MDDVRVNEQIHSALEELMERFFSNSYDDVNDMQVALNARDFESLIRLGHTIKGTGYGYGFSGMGDIGTELEQAAKACDIGLCQYQIDRMTYYLGNVKIEFVE